MRWKFWQPDYDRLDQEPSPGSEPAVQPRTVAHHNPSTLGLSLGLLSGEQIANDMAALGIAPKDDPRKDKAFDDEIDPAWRDPDTAE
jgi:hypothetical protein